MARNYAAFVRPAAAVDAGQNRAGSRGHHVRMQRPSLIPKAELRVPPNPPLGWEEARRALSGLPGGGLNIAHEAVDRHAAGERAGKVAVALHERLKVEIPEADYAKLGTLDEIVAYLAQKKPA
jgi:hypothetical protein